jgi:osmotically-inducible protein OsmY
MSETDAELARAVIQRLEWSVRIPEGRIEVRVEEGRVTLIGDVDWRYQRLAAESIVREIRGVREVTDLLQIRPRSYDADVREKTIDLAWTWQQGRC